MDPRHPGVLEETMKGHFRNFVAVLAAGAALGLPLSAGQVAAADRLPGPGATHDASGPTSQHANAHADQHLNAQVNGTDAYIFEVKPRAKAAGLFKGKIYVDASQGSLLRAEGRLVKSPSIFIKKIEFTADYADFDGVTLPVRIHSLTATRLVGEAIVDISTPKYHFAAEPPIVAAAASLPYESSPKP